MPKRRDPFADMHAESEARQARLAATYTVALTGSELADLQFAMQGYAIHAYKTTFDVYGDHERALAHAVRYIDHANRFRALLGESPLAVVDCLASVWEGPSPN